MSDPIRVVVTGASGHLGSHLVPKLRAAGLAVTGTDVVAPSAPPVGWDFEVADLTDLDRLKEILRGAEAIVHCASIHPWKQYPDEQYLDSNIKGTWQLYQAAAESGIDKIVLTSSIAAIGYQNIPLDCWPVREEREFPISDIYSFTKHTQEHIAKGYAHGKGVRTLALRPPAFFPLPVLETGIGLTANFAVVADIASAHVAALEVLLGRREPPAPLQPFEAFTVTNELPYTQSDMSLLDAGLNARLVEKYWPEGYRWLAARGFEGRRVLAVFDLSKAKRVLGWGPSYNFEQWFAENRGD